ncbi:alpha/beta fold hydrolase [Parasphingorhabdus sp. DH2-15]|uniref:alpha/beta fold hydrolase n=1 Tax=Parasphingorhabdus sp. DH2-15 TaxID=3444112 RepID=UPI003F685E9B
MAIIFLHGVPDTPIVWQPLIAALNLSDDSYIAPNLPGFAAPSPRGFAATKEAYVDWLISQVEKSYAQSGPVHLVGHDWGAILCVRAACLRPDLVASWAVSNAVPEPTYQWHRAARMWQTPLLGELGMVMLNNAKAERVLIQSGMPEDMAKIEAAYVDKVMKSAILKLYRSAKTMADDWGNDLTRLSKKGLLLWGADDPFVPLETALAFSKRTKIPLHIEEGAGHWAIVERADSMAAQLQGFWSA